MKEMISLRIDNYFQRDGAYRPDEIKMLAPYDEEKWRDGKIYSFKTLKEVKKFIRSSEIDFTDKAKIWFFYMGLV